MGNPATLQPKPFTSENQPAIRGRKKGVPNRATVFKRLLKMKTMVIDPENPTGPDGRPNKIQVSMLEAAALGQFQSAMKGNTRAFQEIQDTLFGKIVDKSEVDAKVEHTGKATLIIQGVEPNAIAPSNNDDNG